MAQATIFVELDTSSVTQGSKVLVDQFGNALRTIQNQANSSLPVVTGHAGNLDKTLSRLSSSRAPQLMGSLTSSVAASIPVLRDSAAAMSLMQVSAFGLQNVLVKLVGPAGFILLAVGGLFALAEASKKTTTNIDDLKLSVSTLAQQFVALKIAGIDATGTEAELQKKLKANEESIKGLSTIIAFNEQQLLKLSETGTKTAFTEEQLKDNILKFRLELEKTKLESFAFTEALKRISEFRADKAAEELEKFRQRMTARPPEDPIFKMDSKIFDWGTKQLTQDLEELIGKEVAEREKAEREWEKINQKRLQAEEAIRDSQAQTIQQISSSFAETFADMLVSGKAAWDDLLEYWLKQLLISGILSAISDIFSFGSFGIGGIFSAFGFQSGTSFVPATGFYRLHKGEAVIPATQNPFTSQTNNSWGGNSYNIYVSGILDENFITKELLPKLKRMSQERKLGF